MHNIYKYGFVNLKVTEAVGKSWVWERESGGWEEEKRRYEETGLEDLRIWGYEIWGYENIRIWEYEEKRKYEETGLEDFRSHDRLHRRFGPEWGVGSVGFGGCRLGGSRSQWMNDVTQVRNIHLFSFYTYFLHLHHLWMMPNMSLSYTRFLLWTRFCKLCPSHYSWSSSKQIFYQFLSDCSFFLILKINHLNI